MLTARDHDIIDFVTEFKAATPSIIQPLFFPSMRMCQTRLKKITEKGYLSRSRDAINNEYCYFIKQPKQLRHTLEVSRFYSILSSIVTVHKFKIEPIFDSVRPDAVFVYSNSDGQKHIGLLEVELSNKGFNSVKYVKLMSDYTKFMTAKPTIYTVSKIPVKDTDVINIPLNYSTKTIRLAIR